MKGLLIGTALATLLGGTALAADYGQPINPFVPQMPVYSWTGAYLGLQGGYAWGQSTVDFEDVFGAFVFDNEVFDFSDLNGARNFEPNGFVGGGHLGYLHQFGGLVIGVEGDVEVATQKDSESIAETRVLTTVDQITGEVIANTFEFSGAVAVDYNWTASARGRIGFAFDRVLVYATGGYAYADIDTTANVSLSVNNGAPITLANAGISEGTGGWTVGGGLEALVGYNMSTRLEYRFTDLKDQTINLGDGASVSASHEFHAVRAGLSYHF